MEEWEDYSIDQSYLNSIIRIIYFYKFFIIYTSLDIHDHKILATRYYARYQLQGY